jgi:hypothetical protein
MTTYERLNQSFEIDEENMKTSQTRTTSPNQIGYFLRLRDLKLDRTGNTQYESILVMFFLGFYLLVTVLLAVLTWLVQNHGFPPLTL